MPFKLDKANTQLKQLNETFKELDKEYDGVETEIGATSRLIKTAAQSMVERIGDLRRAGEVGTSYKAFLKDKQVKDDKAGIDGLVKELTASRSKLKTAAGALQQKLASFKREVDAEADKVRKSTKPKDLPKVPPNLQLDKVAKSGAENVIELEEAVAKLQAAFDGTFGRVLKWTPAQEEADAEFVIEDELRKAKRGPTDLAIQTIQHELEPKLVAKHLSQAKALNDELMGMLRPRRGSLGGSPLKEFSDKEDKKPKVEKALKELKAITKTLADAVGTVKPERALELERSTIKKDQQNYEAYKNAKAALAQMEEMVSEAERLRDA